VAALPVGGITSTQCSPGDENWLKYSFWIKMCLIAPYSLEVLNPIPIFLPLIATVTNRFSDYEPKVQ
jgi:hypothetical protein